MKKTLLEKLSCPACGHEALELIVSEEEGGEVIEGRIRCPRCKKDYRIIEGIPVMLPDETAIRQGIWDDLHKRTDYQGLVDDFKQRFAAEREVLLDYFAHARLAKEWALPRQEVLDIGCGSGSYSLALYLLAGKGALTLLDISPAALKGAKLIMDAFKVPAQAVVGDIYQLPFKNNAFDLTLSGGLIEHFVDQAQQRVISEQCRVATHTLMEAPVDAFGYWSFRIVYTVLKRGWPFGFEKPVRRHQLRKWLELQNMEIIGEGGHDIASAMEMLGRKKWKWFPKLHHWPLLAKITEHDLIIGAKKILKPGGIVQDQSDKGF